MGERLSNDDGESKVRMVYPRTKMSVPWQRRMASEAPDTAKLALLDGELLGLGRLESRQRLEL
jgi:hypothetical protein